MSYIVPIHKPNSVRHAVKIRLLTRDEECLVIAKVNRLEIYEQTAVGLVLKCSKLVHGKIIALEKLQLEAPATDLLVVVTEQHHYFTLSWNWEWEQLETEQSCFDNGMGGTNESMNTSICMIDGEQTFMGLGFFDGIVTLVPLTTVKRKKKSGSVLGSAGLARIPELLVRSSAFIYGLKLPTVALLWEDAQGDAFLTTKEVDHMVGDEGAAELKDTRLVKTGLERASRFLIPVPETQGGMLIIGESSLLYLDTIGTETAFKLPTPTIFCAWEMIDAPRYLLADDYGNLRLLNLEFTDSSRPKLDFVDLGSIPRAAVLRHLDNGHVFVGSHQGDSQVIKIQSGSEPIQVVQTLQNISPVLDFTIMDMGNPTGEGQNNEFSSGQSRIVTGSGSFESGSLRSVRSGVALHDIGVLAELKGTRAIFSLTTLGEFEYIDTLLVSFIDETRIFVFSSEGEIEEVESYKGIISTEETILAKNCPNQRIIQTTESRISLLNVDSGIKISEWTSPFGPKSITAVSANDYHIVVCVQGTHVFVFDIGSDLTLLSDKNFGQQQQVACIGIPNHLCETFAIGFWEKGTICLARVDNIEIIFTEAAGGQNGSVPRTLIFAQLLPYQLPSLLVGMADGLVLTFQTSLGENSLKNKRSMVLGTEQANFQSIPRGNGLSSVFATCEHASLIYGTESRIVYSAVATEQAICIAPFNAKAFPGAIVLATQEGLKITVVDTERTTHVQSLALETTVRRIAYSRAERIFGLGTISRTLVDDTEEIQSRVKLVDEVLFEDLDSYDLLTNELVECVICTSLPDDTSRPQDSKTTFSERLIVGTSYIGAGHADSIRGRIIVFEITQERKIKPITELALKGGCRCLALHKGLLIAALSRTVVVYQYTHSANTPPSLLKSATYRTSNTPISLATTPESIIVADIMKSITVLTLESPSKLIETARHFAIAWSTAVAFLDTNVISNTSSDSYILSDHSGNLLVLRQNAAGVTAEDRRRLETTGEFHLGELVNRIQRVDVEASPDAPVIPRAFLATAEGGIYLVATIAAKWQNTLIELQGRLGKLATKDKANLKMASLGGLDFENYRGFKTSVREETAPYRFVDGECIEQFLDLEEETQETAVKGLGDVDEVRALVEVLKRIH